MNDDGKNVLACLGALLLFLLVPAIAILQGWVLTVLWSWFVAPTFNLPKLSIAIAIGFSLIVNMFRSFNYKEKGKNQSTEDKIVIIGVSIVEPFVILFLGWIVHLFV